MPECDHIGYAWSSGTFGPPAPSTTEEQRTRYHELILTGNWGSAGCERCGKIFRMHSKSADDLTDIDKLALQRLRIPY